MSSSEDEYVDVSVLDVEQLKRIEAVHRGFLYQHLFASGCLLLAASQGVVSTSVETDEDIEVILPDRHLYVQVKTRAVALSKADIELVLERFDEIRNAHLNGMRDLKPELWIVSNVDPSPTLVKEVESPSWPADVFVKSPMSGTDGPGALPPACSNLIDMFAWCIEAASKVPFPGLRPDTLVLKLAGAIQFACAGAQPKQEHRFRTEELAQLFEQIVVQMHHLPDSPVPYRAQEYEPAFESTYAIRMIVGFSGAGKTCWAAEGGLHTGRRVAYFDVGDTPGPAVIPCLARELAAQLIASDAEDFRRIFLPGSSGIDALRMLAVVVGKFVQRAIVVLDNAQRVDPEDLQSIVLALPTVDWILLAQPWPEGKIIEARFKIEAENLRGWSLETVSEEFAASECFIGPEDSDRVRRLTGGLPLYVQDAARLTREYYDKNPEKFLIELESLTNARTTGQQAILHQVEKRLSNTASNAVAILAIADIPLDRNEVAAILTAPLELSPAEAAKVLRELGSWGIIEQYRDGRLSMQDAFRVIAKEKQLEIEPQILDRARRSLVEVLSEAPRDISKFRLFCSLLPSVGRTKSLVEIASGVSEYFHEFGLTSEFLRLLSAAADSKDLSPEDRFWAADTVAFWSLERGDLKECSKRLQEMDSLLPSIPENGSEKTALILKQMLISGQQADLASVHEHYRELIGSASLTPTESRVIRYNYAHALFKCGKLGPAEAEASKLIEEYYDALGLRYEDVYLKNPPEIKEKLPDWGDALDDLKHLADSLDLCAHVLNAQRKPSGLMRFHAIKFYALSNAMTSVIRVGQDFVDECLGQLGDPNLARDFMETKLLPHIKESKLLNYFVPVHAQYAVVLAYCGDIGLARKVMGNLESYVNALPQCREEFENQKALIELIAQGKVRLRLRRTIESRPPAAPMAKIGRNDKCPCGSGRKYKWCHGRSS